MEDGQLLQLADIYYCHISTSNGNMEFGRHRGNIKRISTYRIASHSENCSSLLGVAYLCSLNLCCFFFFLSFSFSRSRARMATVPALLHLVWTIDGAKNLGIVAFTGLVVAVRLSLVNEATH